MRPKLGSGWNAATKPYAPRAMTPAAANQAERCSLGAIATGGASS
jgi:hypothetical protein